MAQVLDRVEEAAETALSQVRLLVVEAAADSLLDICLRLHGRMACVAVSSVATLQDIDVALLAPTLILLEVGDDEAAGLVLASRLHRLWPGVGLILLTDKAKVGLRLQGYMIGADHCLPRPPSELELVSAMEALARRLAMQAAPAGDCWIIDLPRQELRLPDGQALELSRNECRVLECLQQAPGQTASRQVLAEGLGAEYLTYDERRLEAIVSRLRRKITTFAGRDAPIRALRNKGYLFTGSLLAIG